MNESVLTGLAAVAGLGIGAQWIAWRLRLPSILILLVFGFLGGPVLGWVEPETLFGELLTPIVSISVGLILFEGGLTLRFSELAEIGKVVRNLISIGALVTWVLISAGSSWILGFPIQLAILFGAILVVTGPTVVLPLLRHVQPAGQLRPILKWEGILNDPVGAVLAVLVFEVLFVPTEGSWALHAGIGVLRTLAVGASFGWLGAVVLRELLHRYWIPDFLQSSFAFMIVVLAFTASNVIQHESGLFTVTLMGVLLANQKKVPIKHIVEFKENLRVLLISSLFILLSARLDFSALEEFDGRGFAFLAFVICVARPLTVFASTRGSRLTFREKLFLSWMAPRGVVAAAVASVFALRLSEFGFADAGRLVPVTFLVIIGTIAVYGLTAQPFARWIKVAGSNPQGVLIVGAHRWARLLAAALSEQGISVMLADTNRANVRAARIAGLRAFHGSALGDSAHEDIDLTGIGRLLAMTPNDEANSLAVLHFRELFGSSEIYQLAGENDTRDEASAHFRGRVAFGEGETFASISERFFKGATFKASNLSEKFDLEAFRKLYGDDALPLFVVTGRKDLRVLVGGETSLKPEPDQVLISIVDEAAEARAKESPPLSEEELAGDAPDEARPTKADA